MDNDGWGKRKGAPSRRVKNSMQLTQGFVSPTLKQDFDAFKKRGSKNPSGGSEVDAAHRTSDHRIRKNFIAFRTEIDDHHKKRDSVRVRTSRATSRNLSIPLGIRSSKRKRTSKK